MVPFCSRHRHKWSHKLGAWSTGCPAKLKTTRRSLRTNNSDHADNIDYDEVKHFIKENTTPSKGKSISVPGRGDDKLREFQDELFDILADQHQRIDLFVRSKSGEIQRRLGKCCLVSILNLALPV